MWLAVSSAMPCAEDLNSQRLAFVALDQAVAEPQRLVPAHQGVFGPSCCRLSHTAVITSKLAQCLHMQGMHISCACTKEQ